MKCVISWDLGVISFFMVEGSLNKKWKFISLRDIWLKDWDLNIFFRRWIYIFMYEVLK